MEYVTASIVRWLWVMSGVCAVVAIAAALRWWELYPKDTVDDPTVPAWKKL